MSGARGGLPDERAGAGRVERLSGTDSIIDEELRLLRLVLEELAKLPPAKTASEEPIVKELDRLRERLLSGDENKDLSALTEQYHNQSAILRQLRHAGAATQIDASSPYFAHLKLEEAGRKRDVCLGRSTCIKNGLRIVDWRDAPISKIFYSYRQGDEFDEEIAGRERQGEVIARRMVRIRDGELQAIQAPEGDYRLEPTDSSGRLVWCRRPPSVPRLSGGERAALRSFDPGEGEARRLGSDHRGDPHRVDKHLPEITSLIDPEQFELITREARGYLVIRGAAGSGKTTVALHRVAYLAFDDPEVDGPQTMVVVFSRALSNYVSHVLPSLGLEHVRIATYRDWAWEERRRHFPELPSGQRDDTPAFVQKLKLHPAIGVALERQVARIDGPNTAEQALDDWASVVTQRRLLAEVVAEHAPGVFSERDLDRFCDWGRRRLDDLYGLMSSDDASQALLDPEDDALLLRAWQLRVGRLGSRGRRPLAYRHLVIDEVQDFSALEVQVLLGCMAQESSITLAGDTQQHMLENSGFTSWARFLDELGLPGAEVDTLRVSYRSSAEIMTFARSLLGDLAEDDDPPLTAKSGPPVELFRFTDRGACVAFLADALRDLAIAEPSASVAVLTPSPAASDVYYEGLDRSEIPRLRRIRDQEFPFTAGIEVTEVSQVKGLEFDYVVLLDVDAASYPDTPVARRQLHVGATRAVHQLWVLTVGTPSPLVGALRES